MNSYLAKTFEIILFIDKYTNDETRMRVKAHYIRHAVLHLDILYINTHIVVIYNIYIYVYIRCFMQRGQTITLIR